MKLFDFDYELPPELIAQYPAKQRDLSRLLVLDRKKGEIFHKAFKDLLSFIKNGDILVLNNTKVINARVIAKRSTGGKVELFLLENMGDGKFKALIRPSGRIREREEITVNDPKLKARVLLKNKSENIVEFVSPSDNVEAEVNKAGEIPLPPYIKRKVEGFDAERYQTVYANIEGATAAPTAGLHFTQETLKELVSKGVGLVYVTLHVSYGTFAPVRVEEIERHQMHSEDFELTRENATKINGARASGGRIFSVGTTSCRVLETCAVPSEKPKDKSGAYKVEAKKGKTDLFIYPSYRFKIVDALLTNFHLPKSTLLMLVSAFAGKELIFKVYEEAIANKYRFFSYGDAMLIL